MTEPVVEGDMERFGFEAFGVTMSVATNRDELRDRILEVLPPGWRPCSPAGDEHRLAIIADGHGAYTVEAKGARQFETLDTALGMLERELRLCVAREARDRIFVHAGVVGRGGGAMLLPGSTFTGKSSLVAALVRAGTTYFSDEYAALDDDGLVHPYPKPLSLRGEDTTQRHHRIETLGGTAGDGPVPVRAIVVTNYRQGAIWAPRRLSTGDGALALLAHVVPARQRPAESLRACRRAAENAVVLESERGHADDLVPLLLAELDT